MGWYQDRDFPEIKTERFGDTPEILAVVENKEQRERLIREYNNLEYRLWEEKRKADKLIEALVGGAEFGGVFWRENAIDEYLENKK